MVLQCAALCATVPVLPTRASTLRNANVRGEERAPPQKSTVLARPAQTLRPQQIKMKMTAEEFIRNNRGINGGKDLPQAMLRALYEGIRRHEIRIYSDSSDTTDISSVFWCVGDGGDRPSVCRGCGVQFIFRLLVVALQRSRAPAWHGASSPPPRN